MISPYQQDGPEVSFMPPRGLAEILAQRNKQMQDSMSKIGDFAGMAGAGITGAIQGGANPGAFGGGAQAGDEGDGGAAGDAGGSPVGNSPSMGAFKGFMQNVNAYNNGGGGMGNFADMVQGRGGSGGGGGSGGLGFDPGKMNVKQLIQAGKTADSYRKQMQADPSLTDDQKSNVMGIHDDVWSTMGTADKAGVMQAAHQALVEKEAGMRMQQLAQQGQLYQQQLDAENANTAAWQQAGANVVSDTLAQGNGPVRPRPVTMQDYVTAAQNGYPAAFNSRAAGPIIEAMARQGSTAPALTPTPYTSPNGRHFISYGNNFVSADPIAAKPPLVGESVDELDDKGFKTGRRMTKVTGDPEAVEAWNQNYNTRRQDEQDSKMIDVIDPSGKPGQVPKGKLAGALRAGYKRLQ